MTKPTKDTPKQTKRPIIDPVAKDGDSSIAVHCAYKELRDITELVPHPRNPNKHGDRQIALLAKIIRHQGWRSPIVVSRRSGFVVAGHGRLQAAQLLQVEKVPVDFQDFETEADEYAHLVADNRIAELAEIDQNELAGILKELDGKIDLDLTGFDVEGLDELGGLVEPSEVDAEPQIDKAEELREKWKVERGQIWQLGEHRLMCGDSTSEDWGYLVNGVGATARALVTSPPYSDQREYQLGSFDWLKLANGFFAATRAYMSKASDTLVNLGMSYKDGTVNQYWQPWLDACAGIGEPLYGWYVWDKGSGFPGEWNGRLAPSHEFVFHFSRGRQSARKWVKTTGESEKRGTGGKRFRQKDGSLQELTSPDTIGQPFKIPDSVIRVGREMARGVHTQAHPAVFPVEFASFLVKTWSDDGDTILEPFSGSGTTIIACERLNRKCRAMEISPAYVAVAIQRWADATGKEPKLING